MQKSTIINSRIYQLKEKLRETDYKAIKYTEGEITIADYMETLNQRKAWRKEINELEIELEKLTTQMVNEV